MIWGCRILRNYQFRRHSEIMPEHMIYIYIYMLSPPKLYHFLVFLAVVTICAQFQPEGNICVVIKPCEKELGRYFILACKMHGFATTKLSLRFVKQNIFVMSFVGCPTSFFLALTRNNFRTLCRGRMQSSTIHAVSWGLKCWYFTTWKPF